MVYLINAILNGLISFVISLVSVLMAPIDNVINTTLPSFSDVLTGFGDFLDQILGVIPWVLSWFHIPSYLIIFIAGYFTAKVTISFVVHEIKIGLAWYRKLMP